MQVEFEGRATLINDTDKLYNNTVITMIGGKDLKFNDLKVVDFLLQNNVEPTINRYAGMHNRGMAPAMADMAMADEMGMPENSNALDNLFVYKMSSIDLQPKSRSSHVFQPKITAEFE